MLCSNCRKSNTDLGHELKFMVCKVCKDRVNRQVHYCSANCQKIDWKNGHKSVCGKALTLEAAESPFTLYQPPPSAPDILPPPDHEKIGPASAPFERSTYLRFQVSMLNNHGNVDYYLRDDDQVYLIDIPVDHQEGRAERFFFRKCRQLAMTTGDRFAIAVLAQSLCDNSRGSKGINRELILKQIALEFEWEGVADAVEDLDKLKALGHPRGLASLRSIHKAWIPEFQEQERQM